MVIRFERVAEPVRGADASRYAFGVDPHRIGELRSIAYHRVVRDRLDGPALARARARAQAATRGPGAHLAQRWLELLDGPPERLAEALVEDSAEAAALRTATPFSGFLSPKERWGLWRTVRSEAGGP